MSRGRGFRMEVGGHYRRAPDRWARFAGGATPSVHVEPRVRIHCPADDDPLSCQVAEKRLGPTSCGSCGRNRSRCRAECGAGAEFAGGRSEEHTSELQSLMRISYAVFCLTKKKH